MQKIALVFLFATMISLVAPYESIFAQTLEEESIEEGMMLEDETIGDEMKNEMMEDEMMEDEMMEMEDSVGPPLKQIAKGTDPHEIQCMDDQQLVFKASNSRPACINESSFGILLERGWVAVEEPSDEDLMNMVNEYMAKLPKEPIEDEIEIEEDVTMEGETSTGNETETQSYTVELREDMEMGAQ